MKRNMIKVVKDGTSFSFRNENEKREYFKMYNAAKRKAAKLIKFSYSTTLLKKLENYVKYLPPGVYLRDKNDFEIFASTALKKFIKNYNRNKVSATERYGYIIFDRVWLNEGYHY